MSFWRSIMGQSVPKAANLDDLFALPNAALTLQTALGMVPTGDGAVCYRASSGAGFARSQDDIVALLRSDPDAPAIRVSEDSFGFTWLEVDHPAFDPATDTLSSLSTDLHAVNVTLTEAGFGPGLLCTVVPFETAGSGGIAGRVGLVYLYKQGTFYPFAPTGEGRATDAVTEIQVRDVLAGELPIEPDRSRWLGLWGAPGL
ncbi:MAG: PspA-associated protein PspAB [Nocardioides sp.]